MLRDDINSALKEAMKAGDKRRVSTLRLINAAILQRETSGAERATLSDAEILDVMGKMIKQRQEALDIYEKAGRAELAAQEREEMAIIAAYLPKRMSDLEAAEAISALIKEIEAATLKDMGRTMAALKARFSGQMDFAKAGALVKKLLGGYSAGAPGPVRRPAGWGAPCG
ncbi:MAG TPA: GatB/YqeY domain-containing protein [Xanthobacteraceae bacterium]|nr:GatB/YqeY domain-containing protein [Xanthobacteraceae bacterium]